MELDQLPAALDRLTYPLTAEELRAALAGEVIAHPTGDEPLDAVVRRSGSDVVRSADDAWLSVVGALDEGAVGRKGYTDRDPPCGPDEFDAVSF